MYKNEIQLYILAGSFSVLTLNYCWINHERDKVSYTNSYMEGEASRPAAVLHRTTIPRTDNSKNTRLGLVPNKAVTEHTQSAIEISRF